MGTIRNKYSGDTINGVAVPSVVCTDVEVVRDGSIYVMRFNGTTSKIDAGSFDTLTGDKTFVSWINLKTPTLRNVLITNRKFYIGNSGGGTTIVVNSDYSTNAVSGTIKRGTTYLLAVTRTSTGIVNIYIDGVLSGTANQSSGTPVAGTSNLTIGCDINTDFMKGWLSGLCIYDGLLTAQEISALYSAEKHLYGL